MKKICNSCGREIKESENVYNHIAENGTEYIVCQECEVDGIEVVETTPYVICGVCGFVHQKEKFLKTCDFCGAKEAFGEIELTQAEEYELDENPMRVYEEKLGKDFADKIAEWKTGEKSKEVELEHKRDMNIDTIFAAGIIVAYFMVDYAIRGFVENKLMFVLLMLPALLTLFAAPIFKLICKGTKKRLPLWLLVVLIAVFADLYWIVLMLIK